MAGYVGRLLALAFVVLLSSSVFADERVERLPEDYRKWLTEEVVYIISDVERETFLSLESENERENFIRAFWRKRDENPSTPENEYQIEHYERLAYVNEFLGRDTFREGWGTDRGKYFILLGPPRNRQTFDGSDEVYPSELWFYDNPDLKRHGLPPFFYLLFFRRFGSGELELYSPVTDGPQALLTGTDTRTADFRADIARAYEELSEVDPELAQASLSFRTDEGDTAQFQAVSFGTMALMDQIAGVPFTGLDLSYAERLDFERGAVEADYLFAYVPSAGAVHILPGPGGVAYAHWIIELDPENVAFVQDQQTGNYATSFIVSMEVVPRDDPDKLVVEFRNESFMRLEGSEAASLHRPFAYSGMTPVIPGAYDLRVILRNRACPSREERDCVKSYTLLDQQIDVPSFSSEAPALSPPVLAYGRELRDGEPRYRAYRFGNVELLPNPSGVYAIGERLVVAFDALNVPAGAQLRYRLVSQEPGVEGTVALDETSPFDPAAPGPIVKELPLEGQQGGRFELVTTLIGASGESLAERSTPLTISPRSEIARPSARGAVPQIRPEIPGIVAMALGEQYLALGDEAKAKASFERALSENEKLGPAREQLARIALAARDHEEVIRLLEPVYAQVKDRYEVLAPLGEAYFRRGSIEQAVDLLERAMMLRRPTPELLNVLANAQYQAGNVSRSLELLQQSLAANPEQPEVKELLDRLRAESGG